MIFPIKKAAKLFLPRWLCISRLKSQAGDAVLLTFDDGPHPDVTPGVLDRLSSFGARAVFFVVGNRIDLAPNLLSRILDEGHWLGNHTFAHPNDRQMAYREYKGDLTKCQEAIFRHTSVRPHFHRPPMGKLSIASLLAPKRLGLTTLTWSCSAEDWRYQSDAAAVRRAEEMSIATRPRDILLFHDEWSHVLMTLDILLPALVSRGLNLSPDLESIV